MVDHADRLPLLPALLVWPDQDADAERAAFAARHGRAPEVVLVITVEDASIPDPGAKRERAGRRICARLTVDCPNASGSTAELAGRRTRYSATQQPPVLRENTFLPRGETARRCPPTACLAASQRLLKLRSC